MAVHTYHREQRKAFYREHVWELMFQKTDSSIYICMIRPKAQIYPSAQVINSPPPVSADGTKNLTSDIQYCKLLRQMVSVTPRSLFIIDRLPFTQWMLETTPNHRD